MNWLLWQLIDSAFPAGGFAHSGGLEAAHQLGEVTGSEELARFAADALLQVGYGALPLVSAAHDDPERLAELDALCDAFLTGHVANRASRAQGRALLTACSQCFLRAPVHRLRRAAEERRLKRHYAPLFGALLRALDIDRRDTQRAFLFIVLRGVLSSAVRLGIAGPYEAQAIALACGDHLDKTLVRCADLTGADLAQTAPLLDVFQSVHDRLYSRLFQS